MSSTEENKIELNNELPKPILPVPPKLIEPINHDSGHDLNCNNEIDCSTPVDFNRDIMKLRLEDCDSNPASSCGEEDEENPEDSFEAVLAGDSTWVEPANDVVVQMVALLDHYFSDDNLVKDKFLLKHVRRNKQGYVSVKLLTSFKKLKHLSRSDWRVTAFCCRSSGQLELNHSGTKVRRKDQLPHIDLPTTSIKTILAKVPTEETNMTVDEISLIFRQYGSLSTVRLIRPGKEIPLDLRNHIAKHPEIGSLTCAVVEFDKTEECQNAYKSLGKKARDEMTGWEYSLLGSGRNPRRQQKKMKAKERQLLGGPYGYDSSEEFSASPYVSSRENSPEIRRRNFPVNQNRQFLTPSPLISPYGSRSNSPARNSFSSSPSFPRRSGDGANRDKWSRSGKPIGHSPLAVRKHISSPSPKATPPSPLAVPNNYGKVSNAYAGYFEATPEVTQRGQISRDQNDIFNYQIETWSNDQYHQEPKFSERYAKIHDPFCGQNDLNRGQMTRSYSNSSFLTRSQSSYGPLASQDFMSNRQQSPQVPSFDMSREALRKSVSPPAYYQQSSQKASFYIDPFAPDNHLNSPLTKSYSNPNIMSFFDNQSEARSSSPRLDQSAYGSGAVHQTKPANNSSFFGSPNFGLSTSVNQQSIFALNNNTEDPISSPGSPWVRRRRDFLAASQGNTPIGSPSGSPVMGRKNFGNTNVLNDVNDNSGSVLRMPRGPPDNATRGFHRESQETRVLGKLEMLSTQVAASACDNH